MTPIDPTLNQQAIILMSKSGFLTVAEVALQLRLHPTTVYRWLKRGDLPAFKIGDNWRVSSEALELWILDRRRDQSPVFKSAP